VAVSFIGVYTVLWSTPRGERGSNSQRQIVVNQTTIRSWPRRPHTYFRHLKHRTVFIIHELFQILAKANANGDINIWRL